MRRTIKSFVLRAGRMSERQTQGLTQALTLYSLPVDQGLWDFNQIFNRHAPTYLEIGFGMGASLFEMAKSNPHINYIGIEVHRAGVGALAALIHDHGLTNIKLVMADAVTTLQDCVPHDSLSGIQIFFPDPWPKKRHHKRRLIQPLFVQKLVEKLAVDGFIHCATDWEDYAIHMLDVLNLNSTLYNTSNTATYIERPATRPLTKFEDRGIKLGHGVWDLMFKKKQL